MIERIPWREYQREGLHWLVENRRCALWLWMGGGKTLMTYAALVDLFDASIVRRVLVVAPKRVIEMPWPDEAAKWRVPLRVVPVVGGPDARKAALRRPADVNLISFDNLKWLFEQSGADRLFDGVVIDEASKLKDHSSKRFKLVLEKLQRCTLFWELTGTPAANSYLGLFTQMALLDGGKALGRNVTAFREMWCVKGYDGHSWRLREGAAPEIQRRVQHLALSLDSLAELNMPARSDIVVPVLFDDPARAAYRELERESLLQLFDGDAEKTILAPNAAVLAGKLRQFTSGAVFTGEGKEREWHAVNDAKLQAIDSVIEELHGDSVLVFFEYQHDLARLRAQYPKAVHLKTPKQFSAWNRGEIPIALAHPRSMGHGLNLQAGGRNIIWYTLCYSNDDYRQAVARLDRQGQTRPVRNYHLIVTDSVDEAIYAELQSREDSQGSLMRALRARAKKLLR